MLMHLDKSQVKSLVKYTVGSGSFDRRLPMMAGYTKFKAMCIGGAGGRAGNSSYNTGNIVYGCGGGGGGSIEYSGDLEDLNDLTAYQVGSAGPNGNNTADGVRAGNGGNGGDSIFGDAVAEGGKAGTGGRVDHSSSTTWDLGVGGAGGLNSNSLGTAGLGGGDRVAGGSAVDLPTGGLWEDDVLIFPTQVSGGGGGGGGGVGTVKANGTQEVTAQAGKDGCQDVTSSRRAPGGLTGSGYGGTGGGANIYGSIDIQEQYGGGSSSTDPVSASGVVAIRLS